jgi:2'-5' RNA ligase
MPKIMGKYFLAIVPDEPVLKMVTELKEKLYEIFGIKYALKSPPHITLKMPFLHNEKKEGQMVKLLQGFFEQEKSFSLALGGVGSFGKRVAFLKIKYPPELKESQQRLLVFTKTVLKKTIEISDHNYHPHMTVAYRDIKRDQFQQVMDYLRPRKIFGSFEVREVSVLKKKNGAWVIIEKIKLSS